MNQPLTKPLPAVRKTTECGNFFVIVCVCYFDSLLWLAKKSLSCASVECSSVRGELPKPESVFIFFLHFPPHTHTSEERLQARKTELGSDEFFQGSAFSKKDAQGCDRPAAGWGGGGQKGKAT